MEEVAKKPIQLFVIDKESVIRCCPKLADKQSVVSGGISDLVSVDQRMKLLFFKYYASLSYQNIASKSNGTSTPPSYRPRSLAGRRQGIYSSCRRTVGRSGV